MLCRDDEWVCHVSHTKVESTLDDDESPLQTPLKSGVFRIFSTRTHSRFGGGSKTNGSTRVVEVSFLLRQRCARGGGGCSCCSARLRGPAPCIRHDRALAAAARWPPPA